MTPEEFEENCRFILYERINKIQNTFHQYGIENFYVSFSGGKDSTVLSELIDEAVPGNEIPRVFCDTGIELNMARDFVRKKAETDSRIQIIQPKKNIKKTLEEVGYPFKSKEHSLFVDVFQRNGFTKTTKHYLEREAVRFRCPKKLTYQFSDEFKLRVSPKCCYELKKKPLREWQKENQKPYSIIGIRHEEGGGRLNAGCLAFKDKKLHGFAPLIPIKELWLGWYIKRNNIEICDIYKPPYNFKRTGCKGCPFNIKLQKELDTMQEFFPEERKQCELIWKPVYDEYRRIGYRLKQTEKQNDDEGEAAGK